MHQSEPPAPEYTMHKPHSYLGNPLAAQAPVSPPPEVDSSADAAAVVDALECVVAVAGSSDEGRLTALQSGGLRVCAEVLSTASAAAGSSVRAGLYATQLLRRLVEPRVAPGWRIMLAQGVYRVLRCGLAWIQVDWSQLRITAMPPLLILSDDLLL